MSYLPRIVTLFILLVIALPTSTNEYACNSRQILYHAGDDETNYYRILDVDTLAVTDIPNGHLINSQPVWSPDQSQIAFKSLLERGFAIYIMDWSGNHLKKITEGLGTSASLIWSPDGSSIAYHTEFETFVYDLTRNQERQVTDNDLSFSSYPVAWSNDGSSLIVGEHNYGMGLSFAQINIDSGERSVLTNDEDGVFDWFVGQMPDGNLLFNSNRLTENSSLHQLDVNTGLVSVYIERSIHGFSWMADKQAFAFMYIHSTEHSNRNLQDIFMMDLETRQIDQVTSDWTVSHTHILKPVLSPNNQHIIFQSFIDGNNELFIIDIDGDNLRQLTFNDYHDTSPVWVPCLLD